METGLQIEKSYIPSDFQLDSIPNEQNEQNDKENKEVFTKAFFTGLLFKHALEYCQNNSELSDKSDEIRYGLAFGLALESLQKFAEEENASKNADEN